MTTSMEKILALISSEIDAMKGTDDVYYKEKLRNGIQDTYQSHKDEFQNEVKFLSQMTEEAVKNAHSQLPAMVVKMYTMDHRKSMKIYTEIFDIFEKISKLK
jgi:hypothetical protein